MFLSDREATDLAGALLDRLPLAEDIAQLLEQSPPALSEVLAELGRLTALNPSPASRPHATILDDLERDPTTAAVLRDTLPDIRSDVLHIDAALAPWVVLALFALRDLITIEVEYDGDRRTFRLRVVVGREEALTARLRRWFNEAPPTQTLEASGSVFVRLSELLRKLFTSGELRNFVRALPDGARLVDRLSDQTSLTLLSEEVVLLLARAGCIDEALFTALRTFAPRRSDEIAQVEAAWRTAADRPHA